MLSAINAGNTGTNHHTRSESLLPVGILPRGGSIPPVTNLRLGHLKRGRPGARNAGVIRKLEVGERKCSGDDIGCPPVSPMQPLKRSSRLESNVRQQIEVFFVLVGTALALADQVLRANELDTFDPFDHLVSKLILDP